MNHKCCIPANLHQTFIAVTQPVQCGLLDLCINGVKSDWGGGGRAFCTVHVTWWLHIQQQGD